MQGTSLGGSDIVKIFSEIPLQSSHIDFFVGIQGFAVIGVSHQAHVVDFFGKHFFRVILCKSLRADRIESIGNLSGGSCILIVREQAVRILSGEGVRQQTAVRKGFPQGRLFIFKSGI